jgi:hypothetical protein
MSSILASTSNTTAGADAAALPSYEQMVARANDHHAEARRYAALLGMEVRESNVNSANLDLFQGHEVIFDNKPAHMIHIYLWGYSNGEDEGKRAVINKKLLMTADSKDGAANLMAALRIADRYGWTIQIASYGLAVTNGKVTKDFSSLADFFIFADGYSAAINDHCKMYASIEDSEANEPSPDRSKV